MTLTFDNFQPGHSFGSLRYTLDRPVFDAWTALSLALAPVCGLAWWTDEWGLFVLASVLATGCAAWFRHLHVRHLSRPAPAGAAATGAVPPPGSLRLVAEAAFMIGVLASLAVIDEVVADPAS